MAGKVEMGRVEVEDDSLVTAALARVCKDEKPQLGLPSGDLVVFERSASTEWRHSYATLARLAWSPPWKAALCIASSAKLVGSYVDKSGKDLGGAYETRWDVRLVRLDDGRVLTNSLATSPPQRTQSYGGFATDSGDPTPQLVQWLKTVQ
jgi:hypothetical protein